jgi:hypothetical protein
MACWRSLSAGRLWRRVAACGWRTGRRRRIVDVAYKAGQAGLTQRVCSDGCAPAAARIAASAAGIDRPCPRPGTERSGNSRSSSGDISLPSGKPYALTAPDTVRIRETQGLAMSIIDLQRRQSGPRAEQLLDRLQSAVAKEQRVRWNETGHARLSVAQELEDARVTVAARLAKLGDDWPDHIAIL